MTTFQYRERSYVRFFSLRTDETLFEMRMLEGALIVWGEHYRPSEFDAQLDGDTVVCSGMLRDRCGTVVTFGDRLDILAPYRVDVGELPDDYDGSWSKDRS